MVLEISPLILVQLLALASKPTDVPFLVHISALVPLRTLIAIEMMETSVAPLAKTSNMTSFRETHAQVVELPTVDDAHVIRGLWLS